MLRAKNKKNVTEVIDRKKTKEGDVLNECKK